MKSTPSSSSRRVSSSLSWREKFTPSPWLPSRRVVSYTETRGIVGPCETKKPRSVWPRGRLCWENTAPKLSRADDDHAHSLRRGNRNPGAGEGGGHLRDSGAVLPGESRAGLGRSQFVVGGANSLSILRRHPGTAGSASASCPARK